MPKFIFMVAAKGFRIVVYLVTEIWNFISSMRRLLWRQLVTSGCCATRPFWKMVVLWYVIPEFSNAMQILAIFKLVMALT